MALGLRRKADRPSVLRYARKIDTWDIDFNFALGPGVLNFVIHGFNDAKPCTYNY